MSITHETDRSGVSEGSGPMEPAELEHAKQLVEDIATQKVPGFIFVVKKVMIREDGAEQDFEIDGCGKMNGVNVKFMLDTLCHVIGLTDDGLIEYLMARQVDGNEYDNADNNG